MINLHLTHGDNYEGVYLRFPDTPAEVAYAMLDSISRYDGETHIVDVKSPVKNLAQFINNACLEQIGIDHRNWWCLLLKQDGP